LNIGTLLSASAHNHANMMQS